MPITDADREAADNLRAILADVSGFWHKPGDDSPLCIALARHREAAEARLAAKVTSIGGPWPGPGTEFQIGRPPCSTSGHSRPRLHPAAD